MREFSKKKLALSDRDFWTVTWVEIVERLVHVQETGALTFRRKRGAVLDERDIVARIMRKENYLIEQRRGQHEVRTGVYLMQERRVDDKVRSE